MAGGGVAFDREAVAEDMGGAVRCGGIIRGGGAAPTRVFYWCRRGARAETGCFSHCCVLAWCRGIGHGGGAGGGFCHSVPGAAHSEPPRRCPFGLGARERADRLGEHTCVPVGRAWASGAVTGV